MNTLPESRASAVNIGRSVDTLKDYSLLVLTDLVDVDHCAPGYVVIRKQGIRLNGQWFDVGITHTPQNPSVLPPDFYVVPVTEILSDEEGKGMMAELTEIKKRETESVRSRLEMLHGKNT